MKIDFWLLDINYEVTKEGAEIRLWGVDDKDRRVLVLDRSLTPYFYLIPKEGTDPELLIKEIESLRERELPLIQEVELVDKKYFGKALKVIKVLCKDPDAVERYAQRLSRLEGIKESIEDDVRYSSRYLIDYDVKPCSWHEIEVEKVEEDLGVFVDDVYIAKSPPLAIEEIKPLKLRVMGFSIICYSKLGSPRPNRDPVIVISTIIGGEEKVFVAKDYDDREVIHDFIDAIMEYDPDVIIGYGSNQEAWPYLIQRCQVLGIPLRVDRTGSEPHTSVYGHISITGRANVDLYDLAKDVPEVKLKTLENVADFLGVKKVEERVLIESIDIAKYWDDSEKRSTLLRFSTENARSIMGIADAMLDFAMQLASLVRLPLDHVATAATGFRVENFLIHEAYKLNELVPKRVERPYFPYVGAIVLKPRPGLHENVAVLDFKSMYPTLMINKNISPDTYIPPEKPEPPCGVNVAPEVGHRFRKEPPGFYNRVLSNLLAVRNAIRDQMKGLDSRSDEYRILDARQKAIKVITNASYGYCGWIGARWYIRPVAEATTAWGREAISDAIKLSKRIGLEVLYGDTDSIFVVYDKKLIEKFSGAVENEIGLEVKPDKLYTRLLFTEAKKKYAGLLPEGRLDMVGLEVVRGDWANIARKVQEGVLEAILKEKSPSKAVSYVRQQLLKLRRKEEAYADFIVWKTLTKPLGEYAVRAPHVEAAKLLKNAGYELTLGDKVGYVITKGIGRLYERAKPYIMCSLDDLDLGYYEDVQVIPATLRILSMFGVSEEDLKPEASLSGYLES